MADVKNFGLVGVGSTVQWAKGGSRIKTTGAAFNLRNAADSGDVALTAAGITSSAGNVTLTTGNLIASAGDLNATLGNLNLAATGATVVIGTDTTLSRQGAGVLQANGTSAFMVPVGSTAQQPTGATGMLRVNNDATPVFEYFNGTVWTQVAGTSALQTEINNIETSLGGAIDSSGNFVPGGFTGAVIGTTSSFTQAIQNVANYAASKDTLGEIFPSLANGNVIYSAGGVWTQAAPGSTSNVQAWDAKLDALSVFDTTGIMVQTGTDTFAGRTLVAPAAGITISNASGVAGNPTFALANDLAALEGLTTTGYVVRTGDGTATTRAVTGTSGNIVVTNGDGVASDTTINLDTVTDAGTGTFVKITRDTFGRVSGTTAVVTADITALVDATYVNVAGDTMTGNLNMGGTNTVTGLAEPTNATDAATKNYVDNATTGLTWKTAVLNATTANVTLSGEQTIDGVLTSASRILVKNQTDPTENGIYVTAAGAWARSADANTGAELDGAAVFVQQGSVNADSGWVQTTSPVTVGTSNVVFRQFSGAGAYVGGTGIDITGNIISTNLGAGIAELPSDEIGIDLFDVSTGALWLTTDGTTKSTATGAALYLKLAASGGLTQDATGLYVPANGITNAMIVNDFIGLNGDTGVSTVSLGQSLEIIGTSTQGISTSVTGQTTTITAADATSSQKGVATFNTASFLVTAGDVTIKSAGVTNTQLVNSTITFTGTSGSDAVALGESMAIVSADSAITTTMGTNSLSIQLNTVDVAHGGTGATTLLDTAVLIGNGTGAVEATTALTFLTDTLTVGTTTIQGSATDSVITATATNGDLVLMPNGTGSVVVGPVGAGLIQSDTALTVRGNTTLTLTSVTGDTTMALPSGTGSKVTISGPTAADYATGLTANDLTNKQYVDDAIATGASSGAIKSYVVTVPLDANGTTNVGAALPAGATIVQIKVNVTVADTAATLQVGKAGGAQYMTTSENDPQTTGLYIAEDYVVEASSVQVQAVVAASAATSGATCTVMVTYKVA